MNKAGKIAGIFLLAGLALAVGRLLNGEPGIPPGNQKMTIQERTGSAYICPMHPFVVEERPGLCPICNMSLVEKSAGEAGAVRNVAGDQVVVLSPDQKILAGVATCEAVMKPLDKKITATGIVTYNQARQAKVTAWVSGRIERLFAAETGAAVREGMPVAEIVSPDLVYAEEEYLLAWKSQRQFATSPQASFTDSSEALMFAARDRLRLLGFKETQFEELERLERPTVRIPIYPPLSGVVIEKIAMAGDFVDIGAPLLTLADLSVVWVYVDVYESDLAEVRPDQPAEIVTRSYPNQIMTGKVTFIQPFLDAKSRTVKVRIELANPELKLRPEMFVNATIFVPRGDCLSVPTTALLDSGLRQIVWVETEPGEFRAREVAVGIRTENRIEILSGLQEGERVASSGTYLIDSEAQMLRWSEKNHPHQSKSSATSRGQDGTHPDFHDKKTNEPSDSVR
jgi:Cu(I)/Ag(I) efflux system membrane fusion protein